MIMVVGIKAGVALCLLGFAGASWSVDVAHPVPKIGLWHLAFLDQGMAREARLCVGPRSQPVAAESSSGAAMPNIPGVSCRNALSAHGDAVEVKTTCKGVLPDGSRVEIEQVARFKGDFDSRYEVSSDIAMKAGSEMSTRLSTKAVLSRLSDDCAGLSDGDIDIKGVGVRSMLP